MLQAHLSKGLRYGSVAPCLSCRKNTQGLCLVVLLLAEPLLMPAVLGIGVQGRPVLAASAQQEAVPVEIDVTVEDGVLSVHVRDARLEDVLRVIAERADLRLRLAGDLGRPITAWFTLRLEEGLRQLVGDTSIITISWRRRSGSSAPTRFGSRRPVGTAFQEAHVEYHVTSSRFVRPM